MTIDRRWRPGAGDGVPVCTGTCAALRYGPCGSQLPPQLLLRSRIPNKPFSGAGDGVPDSRGPTRCSGTAPRRVKCFAFIATQFESLPGSALERETGFGPATFALARQRSTTEPLPRVVLYYYIKYKALLQPFFGKNFYSADKM